jgi:ketosteroid isomerase-like protein
MQTLLRICGFALLMSTVAHSADCQASAPDSMRAWRESLRVADIGASAVAFKRGIGDALPLDMADDAVLLWEAMPVISGRTGITNTLSAQRRLLVSWQPFRVLVSSDGKLGVTFGSTTRFGDVSGPPAFGRYISVWRRVAPGGWKLAARAEIGLVSPDSVKVPASIIGSVTSADESRNPFAAADLAFAKMALDSGAPAAFYHFAAPDAMTLAGTGELNIGPSSIRARLAEGAAGKAKWNWRPVLTIAAPSGDLGATIGTAEIELGPKPDDVFYSKYITIWKRQTDGSIKFVVDGGSGRPANTLRR